MIFLVEFNLDISTRHIDMNSIFAPDREGGQTIISAPSRADREGGQIIISAPSRAGRRLPSLTHPLERMTASLQSQF